MLLGFWLFGYLFIYFLVSYVLFIYFFFEKTENSILKKKFG